MLPVNYISYREINPLNQCARCCEKPASCKSGMRVSWKNKQLK